MHAVVEPMGLLLVGGSVLPEGGRAFIGPPRLMSWKSIVVVGLAESMRDDQPILFGRHVTWEMFAIDGAVATIQASAARRTGLLECLGSKLFGFDREKAERVYAAGPGKFFRRPPEDGSWTVVWQRAIIRCPRCAHADLVDAPEDAPFLEETKNLRWWRRLRCPSCDALVPIGPRTSRH